MSRKLLSISLLVLLLSIIPSDAIDQNRPETGTVIHDMYRNGDGVLTINNNWTRDTVAIITDKRNNPKIVVYLRSKDSLDIEGIKDGEYIPYFTIGEGWNATAKEFDRVEDHLRYPPMIFETNETCYTTQEITLYEAEATNFVPGQFEFPDI